MRPRALPGAAEAHRGYGGVAACTASGPRAKQLQRVASNRVHRVQNRMQNRVHNQINHLGATACTACSPERRMHWYFVRLGAV